MPNAPQLELLRGLYLGEVAVADEKLGGLLEVLRARAAGGLITVVTSDHGEHRLLDHEFSVREQVLPAEGHPRGLAIASLLGHHPKTPLILPIRVPARSFP